jgi:chitodextrinase
MTWAAVPYAAGTTSISMTAATASDTSGVEYYFACVAGGGHDSGWQESTSYSDTGLNPATQYTYQVKARDKSPNQNETAYSTAASAATNPLPPDTTPPTPDPMAWATAPYATGTDSISMTAATASDASGVEYYFACIAGGGHDSGWQDNTTYTDTGLSPDTQYTYQVKARDKSVNQNETAYSVSASAVTQPISSYCTASGNNASEEWIARVQLADIDNTSGSNSGYADFTNISTNLTKGAAYPVILTPAFSGSTYNEYWRVWIDLNKDGDFDDAGELVFDAGSLSKTIVTGSITVPSGASLGSTRMRVIMRYNAAPSPCGTFNYGEVEDYSVNIIDAAPDYTPPIPDPMTWAVAPHATGSASIAMTATNASDASGVEYYFECTAGAGHDSGWQDSPTYTDTGLQSETQYSYRVKARDKSANQNETAWSSVMSATTDVPSTNVEILGSWTSGTSHTAQAGSSRALIFVAHAEDDNADMDVTSVTYGGRPMTKVIEQNFGTSYRAYVVAYILDEAGINSASGSSFVVTWAQSPYRTPAYSSVFLENVNQTNLIGASASNGGSTATVSTATLATTNGDMVIVAGTNGNTGTYSVNNGFTEDIELSPSSADGVAGHKQATGVAETPSITHSSPNRQVAIGFVVQAQ